MTDFTFREKYDINDFRRIIEILRAPGGCPWDAEQTHESVRANVIEEAYELALAIDKNDPGNMCEELGDLLMQVLFHARMEEERGGFDFDDVADTAVKKLIFRHPHVFGKVKAETPEQVLDNWEKIKRLEKAQDTTASAMSDVAETLPALWRAAKVQKKAAKAGFDWPEVSGAIDKLREETGELCRGIAEDNQDNIEEEIGDILFSVVNTARFLRVDPEKALHRSCEKFIERFRFMEQTAGQEGRRLEEMTLDELEALYQRARAELECRKSN